MRPVTFVIDATVNPSLHRDNSEEKNFCKYFVAALQQQSQQQPTKNNNNDDGGEAALGGVIEGRIEEYANRYIKEVVCSTFSSSSRHLHRWKDKEIDQDGIVEEFNNDDTTTDSASSLPGGMAYISISARHALPPSKYPRGKLLPPIANDASDKPTTVNYNNTWMVNEQQQQPPSQHPSSSSHHGIGGRVTSLTPPPPSTTSWMSSYDIANEGIIANNWLEKHTCILPSSILIVTTLKTKNNDPPTTTSTNNNNEDDDDDEVVQRNDGVRKRRCGDTWINNILTT